MCHGFLPLIKCVYAVYVFPDSTGIYGIFYVHVTCVFFSCVYEQVPVCICMARWICMCEYKDVLCDCMY